MICSITKLSILTYYRLARHTSTLSVSHVRHGYPAHLTPDWFSMNRIIHWLGALFFCVSVACAETGSDSLAASNAGEFKQKKQNIVGNFLADEGAIWTSPLHMDRKDAMVWGGVVATTALLITVDEPIARDAHRFRDDNPWVQTVSPIATQIGEFYVPYGIAAAYCLEGLAFDDDTSVDTGLLAVQVMLHSGIVVQVLKNISGRSRPFVFSDRDNWSGPSSIIKRYSEGGFSPYDSFPSGHTITAFSLATVLAERERPWVGYVAYSCAGLCGLSRVTENQHWLSDVVVGAALGVAIGKLEVSRHDERLAIYPSLGARSAGLTVQLNK